MSDKRREPNRLGEETSPYLLQHAYNPVDWFPWGQAAVERARTLDRPIFLSIGYSACHWCHVMEHESFENEMIAEFMNANFVNIKVDREERPDLDQIYMNAVMSLTGHGGWPMSVFLTPDLRPFTGGTYWPPVARMQTPGFLDVLQHVHRYWNEERDAVFNSADQLTESVVRMGSPQLGQSDCNEELLKRAAQEMVQVADRTFGGFGSAPKFPHPMDLRLLLRCAKRFGFADAVEVIKLTCDKMLYGGIYDQLGGGFHRYATDRKWLVPHFEKMLYDNALLTSAYLEAFQFTENPEYARTVRETLDYVLREMTSPEGGFYSTQDADSEGEEGRFFVWSLEEVREILSAEQSEIFCWCYDVTEAGNWEGKTILQRIHTDAEAATEFGRNADDIQQILKAARQQLFHVREQRIKPGRDEKILVSWNGMMLAAMAQAAMVLDEPRYQVAAKNAASFLLENLREADGRLLHSFKDDRARFNAYLDDYACLIDGLVEVYQCTFETAFLERAVELAERMIQQFADTEKGGFFYTSADHEELITRNKDMQDNATPSGNSMAATALLKLARITGRTDFETQAIGTLEMMSGLIDRAPRASGQALVALDFVLDAAKEIVIVPGSDDSQTEDVLRKLHQQFLPNKVVLLRPKELSDEELPAVIRSHLLGKTSQSDEPTIYVCEQGRCQHPVHGVEGLMSALLE